MAALIALYRGEVGEAAAYGQQALAGAGDVWISSIAAAFLVPALAARNELAAAQAVLTGRGLAGELGPTWPFVVVRHARGTLRAAAGQHAAAAADLLAAGDLAERWGISNPAMMAWRSDAALSLSALGDARTATALCDTAAGQTNRQIAQTLFVTLRTVENHLTSSYAKLGISSRPQLAAALTAGRPRGPGDDQA